SASASSAASSTAPRSSASSMNSWIGASKTVFRSFSLLFLSAAGGGAAPLEPLDSAAALHAALGAGVSGMAVGAHVYDDLVARRTRDEAPPTRGAADRGERALRMNSLQVNRLPRGCGAHLAQPTRSKTPATGLLFRLSP